MKFSRKLILTLSLIFSISLLLTLNSCSKKLGYSVVLWSIPEENLTDGQIVPVYIKSNIMHCYVIGVPETDIKCEVPLWQISEPSSKKKALLLAEKFAEYKNCYAKVKLDGLPIRAEAQNTAKQVYRTREGEILKVLYKGNGAQVMAGKSALEGEWLRVLTNNGTLGWCFSYNLTVLTEKELKESSAADSAENTDGVYDEYIKKILSQTWYPEEYQTMINTRRVDLEVMNPAYRFETGFNTGNATLALKDLELSFPYTGVTKTANRVYKFNDTNLTMTIRTSASIILQYVDEEENQKSYNLATLSEDIFAVIQKEQERRRNEYSKIVKAGPIFRSSNYGTLTFLDNGSFEWSGYDLLVPSIINTGSGNFGKVTVEYFISNGLKAEYDGVISFKFETNAKKLNFLYKIEADGIRLEDAQKARYKGKLIQEKSSNPVVIFFAK
ncbi:MAG: SH3 domain-containing protein [Treponemataceae bacterium]|nr:SH3 domain-containing protein [Treponemataceae bacterium]